MCVDKLIDGGLLQYASITQIGLCPLTSAGTFLCKCQTLRMERELVGLK